MLSNLRHICLLALLALPFRVGAQSTQAPMCVLDDLKNEVCAQQVNRVVTLSPHATELVAYVAGVGTLVAVDTASNFPAQVKKLPKIGDSQLIDLERIVSLQPDLVVAWGSGTSPASINTLRRLGVPVFVSEPVTLKGVASNLTALSELMRRENSTALAEQWLAQFQDLRERFATRQRVNVFYQIWNRPLMTLGGRHVVNELIELCGGRNTFDHLDVLAAQVSQEAVLLARPDIVLTSGQADQAMESLKMWRQWPNLPATQNEQWVVLPPDVLVRNGPRLLEGARALCRAIDGARS